jgi:hypothetical protein
MDIELHRVFTVHHLGASATGLIAHFSNSLDCFDTSVKYPPPNNMLRRRRGGVGVSDNMLSADVTDCPCKDNLPSTKGIYALSKSRKNTHLNPSNCRF